MGLQTASVVKGLKSHESAGIGEWEGRKNTAQRKAKGISKHSPGGGRGEKRSGKKKTSIVGPPVFVFWVSICAPSFEGASRKGSESASSQMSLQETTSSKEGV